MSGSIAGYLVTPCPYCGYKHSKVVCTKETDNPQFRAVRRRRCNGCGEAYYVGVPQEVPLDDSQVSWKRVNAFQEMICISEAS